MHCTGYIRGKEIYVHRVVFPMQEHKTMDKGTMAMYAVLLAAVILVFVLGSIYDAMGDVLISIPIMVLLMLTMINDKNIIHIPPALVVLIVGVMYVSLLSHIVDGGPLLRIAQNFLVGVVMGLMGLIVVYVLLGQLPGFDKERPALVSLLVFTFGIALYSIGGLIEYYIVDLVRDVAEMNMEKFMTSLLWVSVGSLFISLFFYFGRATRFFDETIIRFLKKNSDAMGIRQPITDQEAIIDMISEGETEHLEFKSTLRTNLVTGEKDKRMEKAVLKTLVAFLNTEGGALLIGVSDRGEITGIDLESFESKDRMNLHMTNLISSQIGKEFLPYIDFKVVDFEDLCIMRVDCKPVYKPVFLRENKVETYYVRSGPSSVEITGMDLLNYVNDRKERKEN